MPVSRPRLERLIKAEILLLALAWIAGIAASIGAVLLGHGAIAALFGPCAMLWGFGWFIAARKYRDMAAQHDAHRKRAEALTEKMRRDHLTGHLNRAAFNEVLGDLARHNSASTMVELYFFDLNRFKQVNDTLGHEVGDQLLREVGKRAAEILPDPIALARLGGDEFAAILPYRDEIETRRICEDLVKAIRVPFRLNDCNVEVNASVGVAIGDPAVHGGDELLRRADLAMYEVKSAFGGAYHIFDDLLSNRQLRENSIRTELGKAQFDERFTLHYQPIVNARTGLVEKAEALLRSKGDALSGISPSLMVSVAEDSGQIIALTEWTLDCALRTANRLGIPVAANVSPVYFRHPEFVDRLVERLIDSGSAPSSLIVEITEGVLISDIKSARTAIDHLRAIGVQVFLDDFGTGYSSLSYLQNFELDGVKLDRSFIQDLGKSEKAVRIIRSMIDFSHSLNMLTVIEGVESEWQARILQLQGSDFLQGYEIGLPMPEADLAARLAAERSSDDTAVARHA